MSFFDVKHDPSLLHDFVALSANDVWSYIQQAFFDWNGQHQALFLCLDENFVIRKSHVVADGHKTLNYSMAHIALSLLKCDYPPHLYLVHMVDQPEFVDFQMLSKCQKETRMMVKNLNVALLDHLLVVGGDSTPVGFYDFK